MNVRRGLRFLGLCAALALALPAAADWRTAKVRDVYIGYDGQTTSFTLVGYAKSGCTCYPTWPDRMCLQRTRASYKEEVAAVWLAKTTDRALSVNIDENTCAVLSLGIE